MPELIPFFIILLAGVVFSELFNHFHIPWVVALVTAGIITGPHGLGWFEITPTIEFLGQIGLVFLMFMAGLEVKFSSLKKVGKEVSWISVLNLAVPLGVGFGVGTFFGYGPTESILLGIVFGASSVAVVIPSFTKSGLFHTRLGRSIVGATVLEDIVSLVFFSVILHVTNPTTSIPLGLFYALVFGALVVLRWVLRKLEKLLVSHTEKEDLFQQELRVILTMLVGTVIIFQLLGLHGIIAGFFSGLVLSEFITSEKLIGKLRTLSYGLFIPVFFVVVGGQTNIKIFSETEHILLLASAVVGGAVAANFISGWVGGKLSGFSASESVLVGVATVPLLSTSLAVAATAFHLGMIDATLRAVIILLSIVTTFLGPILIRGVVARLPGTQEEENAS